MHHLTTTHLNCPVLHGTINPATNTQQKSCLPVHTQNMGMGTTIHYNTTCLGPASHYHPRSTLCVCVCVRACVHNIPQYSFTFAVYLPVLHMCIQIRVWSCKCLFTETAVHKFLRGWAILWPETFLFCPLHVFIHFSASFCRAHCALYFWLGTMHHRNAHYYYY